MKKISRHPGAIQSVPKHEYEEAFAPVPGARIRQTKHMLQMLLSGYPTDLQKLPGKAG